MCAPALLPSAACNAHNVYPSAPFGPLPAAARQQTRASFLFDVAALSAFYEKVRLVKVAVAAESLGFPSPLQKA